MSFLSLFQRRNRRGTHRRGGRTKLRPGSRNFGIEPLEGRLLLNGDPLAAPAVDADPQFERFASAELRQFLIDEALSDYGNLFGQPIYHAWLRNGMVYADAALMSAADSIDHSETNVQVAGVDESDLVETDGDHLYVVSGGELAIVKALPADDLRVASRWDVDGTPLGLYLNGDRLTIISQLSDGYWFSTAVMSDALLPDPPESSSPKLQVTVLDVSDPTSPVMTEETEIEGRYVSSRAVGDVVYVVTSSDFRLPSPRLVPADDPVAITKPVPSTPIVEPVPGPVSIDVNATLMVDRVWLPPDSWYFHQKYESQEEYLARLSGKVLELVLPDFTSFGPDGQVVQTGFLTEPADVYRPLGMEDDHLITVVTFDTGDTLPGPVSSAGLPWDYADQVYASASSLYLADRTWRSEPFFDSTTAIAKFDVDAGTGHVELSAHGTVPGWLLDQFSMDEHAGYLRVATTISRSPMRNNVYVLEQNGLSLEIVGRLEGLAQGEQIFSARFLGDVAFVVTFRRVDPLFTIDLSDPTDPAVLGELKIPGFSGYLQAVDGDHLFGIGRDADPVTGRARELQISLFDVQDLSQPQLQDRYTIDFESTQSEALDEHHAVGFFPEYDVLAIPVTVAQRFGTAWNFHWQPPRTEMWVFRIDVGADPATDSGGGISLLGRVDHEGVRRSVRIDDLLYLISDDRITVHRLLDPEWTVNELHLDWDSAWDNDVISSEVELRLVRKPTPTDAHGQLAELPADEPWLDEWDSHWAEIWVRTDDGQHPVNGGSVDLAYRSDVFTATQIDYGPVFTRDLTGVIDDVAGTVTGIGGKTVQNHDTGDRWLLFARVKFESLGDDQLPAAESSQPLLVGVSLTGADLSAVHVNQVDEKLGDAPGTELRPVVYDVNDDQTVDADDLNELTSIFRTDVINSDAQLPWTLDFNRSGMIDFVDFAYLAGNFRRRRGPGAPIRFDEQFGRRWVGGQIDVEGGVTVDEIFDAAVTAWQESLDLPQPPEIQLAVRDLPDARLSESRLLPAGREGLPMRARIIIDDNAQGAGWHGGMDDFTAANRHDLLEVLVGEIGKALDQVPAFAEAAVTIAPQTATGSAQHPVLAALADRDRGILAAVAGRALSELDRKHGAVHGPADSERTIPTNADALIDAVFQVL